MSVCWQIMSECWLDNVSLLADNVSPMVENIRMVAGYTRAHIMFCNRDELMSSPLCFFYYIIDQFGNTYDKNSYLIPYNHFHSIHKMSSKGDGCFASSVDLSQRDFRAMMYYDYCQGKSFQECFQSLKHCFGDRSPSKATVCRWFRQFLSGARTLEDHDRCGQRATTVTTRKRS